MDQIELAQWLVTEYGAVMQRGMAINVSEKDRYIASGEKLMLERIIEKLEIDSTVAITRMITQGMKVPGFPEKPPE